MKAEWEKWLNVQAVVLVIGVSLVLPANRAQAEETNSGRKPVLKDPIVGLWNCAIPPTGGAPAFTVLKNVQAGGTESEIDNAAPPSQESPTVGTWAKTGPLTYSQNAFQMSWDASGNFLGTWNYTGPLTLDPTHKQLNIQGMATFVDANGNVVTSFGFTATCARL